MFCIVKGHVLHCKRASFTRQKGTFYIAKGHLLQHKRRPFKNQLGKYFTKRAFIPFGIHTLLRPKRPIKQIHSPTFHPPKVHIRSC